MASLTSPAYEIQTVAPAISNANSSQLIVFELHNPVLSKITLVIVNPPVQASFALAALYLKTGAAVVVVGAAVVVVGAAVVVVGAAVVVVGAAVVVVGAAVVVVGAAVVVVGAAVVAVPVHTAVPPLNPQGSVQDRCEFNIPPDANQ
jgi:hypothetical protein